MAAHGEKIDELFKIAHTLTERVDGMREELKGGRADLSKVSDTLADLSKQVALLKQELSGLMAWKEQFGASEFRAEIIVLKEQTRTLRESVDKAGQGDQKTEVVLLKDQVKKLQEAGDRFSARAWALLPNLLAAVVGGLISAAIAYYVTVANKK